MNLNIGNIGVWGAGLHRRPAPLKPLRNNLEQKEVRRENERRDLRKVFQRQAA